ncbi:ClpXP protease specificity-enhancing factor [Halomonas sp. LS-001]
MRSSRPYLARALYEWLVDNELTPYLVVDASLPGVEVPRQFVQNGQIVLNVAPTAVRDLYMENQAIGFSARFGGHSMQVMIPIPALIAIYARENGAGMVFGHEPELDEPELDAPDTETEASESSAQVDAEPSEKEHKQPALSIAESTPVSEQNDKSGKHSDTKDSDARSSKSKKKPTLRVIK